MLSPSSASITTTSPTSKAPVSSSKQKHQIAEELADFHGPSSCSYLLDEAFVKATGSDIHLVKQDAPHQEMLPEHSHNEVQGASEFQLHLQNFEEAVDIHDSLPEKRLYPVDSMNSRESGSEIVKGGLHKNSTPEESTVGSSSQVKIELSQVALDAQEVLEEYKVSLPLPEDPTVLSPSNTPLTAEALASSSTNQHPPAEELVDFHGLFKIKERQARLLEEAFVKYPHLWDWKISQKSLRFCKWGCKSLTNMLELLETEKPRTMDDSKRKKFEDLCLELESFGFDKEWLASIRQRVMDMQVDHNDKLKQLVQLKSDVSSLEDQLNVARARMDSIEHNLSKLDHVFGL